jgi:uncharacterized protein DUF4325
MSSTTSLSSCTMSKVRRSTSTNLTIATVCGPYCVDPVKGAQVGESVAAVLQSGETVCLDFTGVKVLTSRFVVAAVGSLYGRFTAQEVEERLSFVGLDRVDEELVREVQVKAQQFYAASPELRARLAKAGHQPIAND